MDTTRMNTALVRSGQYRSAIAMNETFLSVEPVIAGTIEDDTLSASPSGLTLDDLGKVWKISGTGTGDWTGHTDEFAILFYGAWLFTPLEPTRVFRVLSGGGSWKLYDGTTWRAATI